MFVRFDSEEGGDIWVSPLHVVCISVAAGIKVNLEHCSVLVTSSDAAVVVVGHPEDVVRRLSAAAR